CGTPSTPPGARRAVARCTGGRRRHHDDSDTGAPGTGGALTAARVSEALRKAIAASPPGTLFTREGLLEVLAREEASEPRPLEWLDLKAAAAILGTDERKLRRMCARWERERAAGRK